MVCRALSDFVILFSVLFLNLFGTASMLARDVTFLYKQYIVTHCMFHTYVYMYVFIYDYIHVYIIYICVYVCSNKYLHRFA